MQLIVDGAQWLTYQDLNALELILCRDDGRLHLEGLETLRLTYHDAECGPELKYSFESAPPRLKGEMDMFGNLTWSTDVQPVA